MIETVQRSEIDAAATTGPQLMTPSEAFVETLRTEGICTVPGIVGSAFMDALDLFPDAGIRFISVAHEQNAVHMADGMARVTGQPSLVISQNGPGITNFVTGVAAAYWAHTPMVVVTVCLLGSSFLTWLLYRVSMPIIIERISA